ncbi:L-aspartate oxidase [Clostridium carnis]
MNKSIDVLIIGSGISGLTSALEIRNDTNVMIVSKGRLEDTNSLLAQGGISTVRGESDFQPFIEDTLRAGRYKNNLNAVKILALESNNSIEFLKSLGVKFDENEQGLDYTKEGAHSINRILHIKDNTGEYIEKALIKEVKKRKNIILSENTYLADIIEEKGVAKGAILFKGQRRIIVNSKCLILATGGIGGLYKNSTNQKSLTGDGIAIAIKHNIKVKDLNYIQIHPTAFFEEDIQKRRFLISESLRGEGGKLKNINGERFINELLPRDIVTKAIYKEMKKTKSNFVYLDISFLDRKYIINRFSKIYNECLIRGVDITKSPIKVSPAQHYFMGGIEVDLNSKTSMDNLYAVGETSCTGVHGANRLASNSLLEAIVFARRASKAINKSIDNIKVEDTDNKIFNEDLNSFKLINNKLVLNIFNNIRKEEENELDYCR